MIYINGIAKEDIYTGDLCKVEIKNGQPLISRVKSKNIIKSKGIKYVTKEKIKKTTPKRNQTRKKK